MIGHYCNATIPIPGAMWRLEEGDPCAGPAELCALYLPSEVYCALECATPRVTLPPKAGHPRTLSGLPPASTARRYRDALPFVKACRRLSQGSRHSTA